MAYETCLDIESVVILFSEYEVVLTTKDNFVFLQFPYSDNFPGNVCPDFIESESTDLDFKKDLDFKRNFTTLARSLGSNSHFLRVTSTAHHITNFVFSQKGKEYGAIKCIKKAGELFTIVFDSEKNAKDFKNHIESLRKTMEK